MNISSRIFYQDSDVLQTDTWLNLPSWGEGSKLNKIIWENKQMPAMIICSFVRLNTAYIMTVPTIHNSYT